MTTTTTTWKLAGIFDVRPIDWLSGKRISVSEESLPTCDRCGKKHAKVYRVESTDGQELQVGSGCWEKVVFEKSIKIPETEIRKAKKNAAIRTKMEKAQVRLAKAIEIAENIATQLPREWVLVKSEPSSYEHNPVIWLTYVDQDDNCVTVDSGFANGWNADGSTRWVNRTQDQISKACNDAWRQQSVKTDLPDSSSRNLRIVVNCLLNGESATVDRFFSYLL